jgi:acylphosphatase
MIYIDKYIMNKIFKKIFGKKESKVYKLREGIIRRSYVFYGNVQGVGFRYYARQAADSLRVTGWVENEYDGTVLMEAQGLEEELDRMLVMIQTGRYIEITGMDVKNIPVLPDERGFHVKDYY